MSELWQTVLIGAAALCLCLTLVPEERVLPRGWGRTYGIFVSGTATLVGLALLGLLSGCGASTWTVARTSIETGAVVVDVGDGALAAAIRADCGPLVEHLAPGSEERLHVRDLCLADHHFDDAITAVDVADHALRVAQATVDAAERAHDEHVWTAAAPCLGLAVHEVVAALSAAGVTLPPEVLVGLTAIEAFAGTCAAPAATP